MKRPCKLMKLAAFLWALGTLAFQAHAEESEPGQLELAPQAETYVMRQVERPLEWDAWAKWVENVSPLADEEGHGPDVGSDEWAAAVAKKTGIGEAADGPELKSLEWRRAVQEKLMPEPEADPNRQLLSSHRAIARFSSMDEHQCRGRTRRCPDDCGHSGKMVRFKIMHYEDYQKPGKYGDEKQEVFRMLFEDNKGTRKVSEAVHRSIMTLEKNQAVRLRWNHDYVTRGGSKFPERPLIAVTPVAFSVVCSGPLEEAR